MSENGVYLFSGTDLSNYLRRQQDELVREVKRLSPSCLVNRKLGSLAARLADKFALEPITLRRRDIFISKRSDSQVDTRKKTTPAVRQNGSIDRSLTVIVEFVVPFDGEPFLLQTKPAVFRKHLPRAQVVGQELRFRYRRSDHNEQAMKADFERDFESVHYHLKSSAAQTTQFNESLKAVARRLLEDRRDRVLKDKALLERLRATVTVTDTPTPLPTLRIKPEITSVWKPVRKVGAFEAALLTDQHYDHILGVIGHLAIAMERTPRAFRRMREEDLRDHILSVLNAQYEAQATGETFNVGGKTDILVRINGRNVSSGKDQKRSTQPLTSCLAMCRGVTPRRRLSCSIERQLCQECWHKSPLWSESTGVSPAW